MTDVASYVIEHRDGHWSGWLLYCRTDCRDHALRAISYLIRHVGVDRCRMREIAPASGATPRLNADDRLLLRETIERGRMTPATAAKLFGPARDVVSRRRASAATLTLRRHDLIAEVGRQPGATIPTVFGRQVAALLDDDDADPAQTHTPEWP